MLELKNITKDYYVADETVKALKGVSLAFRDNEFVSILGASGCGKTTLLNIIGGLDRYTEGDIIINGKSTKDYKDKDWDNYRNHRIGFVFQSYNLIPHQTVLENVELALTLAGINKAERKERAIEALRKVGLIDKINNKPAQLSGGQMQRVAIARAIVNNPDIILADEPTGALDTVTGIQVMEILKEISKDKLIVMVTHNPDLAEQYSTRIVKLNDGLIVSDSNPVKAQESTQEKSKSQKTNTKKKEKTSMSFFTALSLSFRNLLSKKARTFMVSFAGSIGIIGIALIMSLSNGFQLYIDRVQRDTLSSYPVTIQSTTMDLSSFMTSFTGNGKSQGGDDAVYSNDMILSLVKELSSGKYSNNLKAFKQYIEEQDTSEYLNAIEYQYKVDLNVYSSDTSSLLKINPTEIMSKIMGTSTTTTSTYSSSMYSSSMEIWSQMIDNRQLLEQQYRVVSGKWATESNEVMLVLNSKNQISDYTMYALGLKSQDELDETLQKIRNGEEVEITQTVIDYDDILDVKYKVIANSDYYQLQSDGTWKDMSEDETYVLSKLSDALEVKVVGIIKPRDGVSATAISGSIAYNSSLTDYLIDRINNSAVMQAQLSNPTIDIFTNTQFKTTSMSHQEIDEYIATLPQEKQNTINAYKVYAVNNNISEDNVYKTLEKMLFSNATYDGNLEIIGKVDKNNPDSINLYAVDFESKDKIVELINTYNNIVSQETYTGEGSVIKYTDYVGLLMSSITTIINTISYVLIGFVSISLIVSSIMIGVITYISVLERTKEIGVLRALGASKKDVARLFNAETVIMGFCAGLLGVLITVVLCIPISLVVESLADIQNVASLPLAGAIALVIISVVLTYIAGLIPSRGASKKDPVVALRTE